MRSKRGRAARAPVDRWLATESRETRRCLHESPLGVSDGSVVAALIEKPAGKHRERQQTLENPLSSVHLRAQATCSRAAARSHCSPEQTPAGAGIRWLALEPLCRSASRSLVARCMCLLGPYLDARSAPQSGGDDIQGTRRMMSEECKTPTSAGRRCEPLVHVCGARPTRP